MRIALVAIAFIIFSAGCISQSAVEVKEGLDIRLTADPSDIHFTEGMTLFVDMENKGNTDFERMDYNLFDTGTMACGGCRQGSVANPLCQGFVEDISPKEIVSLECELAFRPDVPLVQQVSTATLKFKAITANKLRSTAVLEMLSQDEWRRRVTTGTLQTSSGSTATRDNNIQMNIDFTKAMPFAESAASERVLFTITVKNVGNGFIDELTPDRLTIQQNGNLVGCDFSRKLVPLNGQFPPIFCELAVNAGGALFANYPVTFALDYSYEVRDSADITIRR